MLNEKSRLHKLAVNDSEKDVQTMNTMESQVMEKAFTPTLLLVDDEENILSSLRRLFRPLGYRILTAQSGVQGMEVMAKETVDLIISDMRMPEMDGAKFLSEVAKQWPDTVRILLTGYSDLTSTITAVNQGRIYCYLSKPWEDDDIKTTVKNALERKFLEHEKQRLEELTRKQNEELREFNTNLEKMVQARTAEIQQTADMLDLAFNELRRSYVTAIPVFANLVEMREGSAAGHGRRVAEQARALAQKMGLAEEEVENIYFAGLLHDVGKIGLPDALINRPYIRLSPQERAQMEKHPVMGEAALLALEPLEGAAKIIRAHHERFDGKGYPDLLFGDRIPMGARVLAVVNDYDALLIGSLLDEPASHVEARAFIVSSRGQRYDPVVADTFVKMLDSLPQQAPLMREVKLTAGNMREGMVLARDLVNTDGMLLLTKGYRLTGALIEKIKSFERDSGKALLIHVEEK
ncbi:MAG: response regulator [Gammaproteobacteria bacterium]